MALVEADPNLGARIVEDAKQYVLYSWSVQDKIDPIPVAGAEGRYFWDYEGKRYLDFASQLVNVNIGHQHPKIIAAIKEQADRLATIGPPMANESRSQLGRLLAEVAPGDLNMSFFTNSGAEANENAIKLARLYTGRHKIIARYRSYHGATHGAVMLTGDPRRWPNEPGMGGVVRMLDPYTYRCPAGHPDPCPVCTGAPHLEELLQYEGPQNVAAVLLETVTGTNGVIPPPEGYLQSIREVCDRHGILLVLDEIMAGFGRTGRWFASENWDVVPDIVTVAKGINSGYVPLGAMIISGIRSRTGCARRFFPGGLTYAGHPLACAAGSRRSRRSARRASSRTRPRSGRISASACAGWPRGTRRSARCAGSAASGAWNSSRIARPVRRSCRSTRPARQRHRSRGSRRPHSSAGST